MPLISLVCPIYKTEKFLGRAIDSILDQDFQDWELICVCDGYSRKAKEIIGSYNDKRIKIITISHAGACRARNEGAKLATGKYISFFSSDFYATPGMLRTWILTFGEHPEADFIYGGYSFPDRNVYPSEEFDARQLETYNYIDGGFPLKREIWQKYPWDEKIKSLNDWDFWLRIVKAGYKGYYMQNYYSYTAEYPRPGGLSYDSSQHWLERIRQIKLNNNVPLRKICVSSLGAPFHAKKVAKMLDADFIQMPSQKPHEYEMIYLLGFYPSLGEKSAMVFSNAPPNCKKVIHWLGSDIGQLWGLSVKSLKALREAIQEYTTISFVESEAKQKEMAELGFKTEILPLLRDMTIFKREPMPKNFSVAIYMPSINTALYNPILMENIVKNMPDVEFIFYGNSDIKEKVIQKNLSIIGWKEMPEIIRQSSMLLRFTSHDGLPTAPLEFIVSGRFVLTNAEMPYVDKIDGDKDSEEVRKQIVAKIREIKKRAEKGQTGSEEAEQFYRNYLEPEHIKKRLYDLLEK